jgi:uncharacterized membrane protein
MKRKFIIVFVCQSLLILLMAMYAFVQRAAAETAKIEALNNHLRADEVAKECTLMREKAKRI